MIYIDIYMIHIGIKIFQNLEFIITNNTIVHDAKNGKFIERKD